ncbi:helix-turn-helix domain-containing protein [Clostridium septicum]|uniref:Helix-turn-helix transcriptional regulator n=1 Tax=Clostridium septicum TaxID=1504 RepID=A0A9N7JNY9_CLOSE|nr:helix-turn-helix transcriptional regulator [Clostridium septicum]AYE35420.1 XRE family transcriptional regulator [Clostridium septicum]MDU1315275.1 helix-turn-helix transcriptional regulator [Clostridium septicum]QAS60808.1 XRE family transcriptional regulator [Clostridium septicum]UEC19925.1 helix-turn-helix transcriptional regulator [Clostridium septicum]USS02015.1 helix-turn-helix transcriptional regulator [Clostridium septicum]
MTTFADRLKEERTKKNLTQSELATILYLGQTSVSKYENGKQIPETPTLQKIADFFEVSVDYLLGKTNIRNYEEITTEDKINKLVEESGINTIAAHFKGEKFTEDDLEDIENFINFVLAKKKKKK